jgi:hypothetical protein
LIEIHVSKGGFFERLSVLALCAATTGCATLKSRGTGSKGKPPVVAGVWEGMSESTLKEGAGAGDTRIERQAWRLHQSGDVVSGFYVVELTMISGDGRPYLCSREPRFSTLLRFDVRGRIAGDVVDLEEVGDVKAKGPCRPTLRNPSHYRAAVRGDVLTVSDGERRMPLYRTTTSANHTPGRTLLAFDVADSAQSSASSLEAISRSVDPSEPPANIEGLWTWEHRGPLPSGDEKLEREEWHLSQEGTTISGYYDRAVHQISTDGHAYRCSSALDFRVTTRYQISGEVRGSLVVLQEKGFEILEGSPCDDGRRRLDAYQGQAGSGEIRLIWGVGTQVLKRARPTVPTQRF